MKAAARIAIFYLFFGFLWIYFSDYAISLLFQSAEDTREIQSFKGWGFVSVSAFIIYILLVRELKNQKKFCLRSLNQTNYSK